MDDQTKAQEPQARRRRPGRRPLRQVGGNQPESPLCHRQRAQEGQRGGATDTVARAASGGHARAVSLTKAERSAAARKAAMARHHPGK